MKSIFAILAMMVGISCFAEVFNIEKANELSKEFNKTKSAAARAALEKYYAETEFNKEQSEQYNKEKLNRNVMYTYKGEMTREAILAYADKLFKTTDEDIREYVLINTLNINRACNALKAEIDGGKIAEEHLFNNACAIVSTVALEKRNYDEAIKYSLMITPINNSVASRLMRAYGAKGQADKAFEIGARLFLETYITSPTVAMDTITKMMNQVPASYDDAKLAELLAKIGRKYPAPGADFEAWKGFMGFIGYRYKALTGKDLFANSNK